MALRGVAFFIVWLAIASSPISAQAMAGVQPQGTTPEYPEYPEYREYPEYPEYPEPEHPCDYGETCHHYCIPRNDSYDCQCFEGYSVNLDVSQW